MAEKWISSILTGLVVIVIGYAMLLFTNSLSSDTGIGGLSYFVMAIGGIIITVVIFEKFR